MHEQEQWNEKNSGKIFLWFQWTLELIEIKNPFSLTLVHRSMWSCKLSNNEIEIHNVPEID